MTLEAHDFGVVRRLLEEQTAISLDDDQGYLVESRLTSLARELGCPGIGALVTRLPHESDLRQRVIEALTTNETSFFRDRHPFEALKAEILPDLILRRAGVRQLSIWSAASSCGQEAYSIAMLLREAFPQIRDWRINMVGTDISQAMVDKAKAGVYSQLEIGRGLPSHLLLKYFDRYATGWRVKRELAQMVEWRVMNLARMTAGFFGFDLVFLRNVLIYFQPATRVRVLTEVLRAMKPDGYLFLGSTETPTGFADTLTPKCIGKSVVYTRSGSLP